MICRLSRSKVSSYRQHRRQQSQMEQVIYEITIQGALDTRWSHQLYDMTAEIDNNGNTRLVGPLPDQSALHGVLNMIRDLNLKLISVRTLETD